MDKDKEKDSNKEENKEEDDVEKGSSKILAIGGGDNDDVESNKGGSDSGADDNNSSRPYSDNFYCPKTKDIFRDPVVVPDGTSYERSAVEGSYNPDVLYDNRALKEIIEETKSMTGDDMRASLMRMQKSMRDSFRNLLDKSVMPSEPFHPLPDVYYCPITLEIMHEPVIDKDGTTYERLAITKWIKANGKSPTTREDAKVEDLYPNNAIYDLIHDEVAKSDGSIHPAILKWKNTKPTEYPSSEEEENNNNNNNDDFASFPTTEEQLSERARRQREKACTIVAIFFAGLSIFYFFPYMFGIFILFSLFQCFGR